MERQRVILNYLKEKQVNPLPTGVGLYVETFRKKFKEMEADKKKKNPMYKTRTLDAPQCLAYLKERYVEDTEEAEKMRKVYEEVAKRMHEKLLKDNLTGLLTELRNKGHDIQQQDHPPQQQGFVDMEYISPILNLKPSRHDVRGSRT